MRKLMWITLGFGVACALWVWLLPLWISVLGGVILLALSIVLRIYGSKAAKAVSMLFVGFVLACLWCAAYDGLFLAPVRTLDGTTQELTIRVTDYSFDTQSGITGDGKVRLEGKDRSVRFYLNTHDALKPGDTVTGVFRLRYTGIGGVEDPTYHSADRIFLLAYPKEDHTVTYAQSVDRRYSAAALRQYLLKLIDAAFPEDAVGFVKALLLGDTSGLDYATDTSLKLSGIRHVAAVSGLHVSILFSIVYLLSGRRRLLSALIGIPVLVLFAAMAGFSASVVRACLMQLLMLLALVLQKEYDPPTALAFAVITMLGINPMAISSVGFQLSVASVVGIFLFAGRITGWMLDGRRLGRWKKKRCYGLLQKGATSVAVSLSALVLTTPLCAWYFGNVSLVSVLTNLLCMWVVTGLFCGIILTCIVGSIYLPLAKAFGWVLAWLVRYVLGVAGLLSRFPLASVYTESVYIVAWLVFCYVLLGIFLISREKRPRVLLCCTVLSLCISLLASWVEPKLDAYRVTVVDVGQGQCVLLQCAERTYMVDCGGDYDEGTADKAASVLLSQGIFRLDGLILTHYDRDHVGGAQYLLSRIPADMLILPQVRGTPEQDIIDAYGGTPIIGDQDMTISWADAEITVYASQNTKSNNESSLCVLFHTKKCDILITGDRSAAAEALLLWHADIPKLDALVVGHHGAETSTSEALLAATQPKVALISVGEDNQYGHPAQKVLERLKLYGCEIRRTDLEGTIIIRG